MEELFWAVSEASCRNAAAALSKKRPSSASVGFVGSSNKRQKKKTASLDAATKALLLKAIDAGRNCKDGRRRRALLFEQLPDFDDYPEYHELIKKPVSLSELTQRVKNGEYDGVDAFKTDVALLVANAVSFNLPDSIVCDDARAIVAAIEAQLKAKGGRR